MYKQPVMKTRYDEITQMILIDKTVKKVIDNLTSKGDKPKEYGIILTYSSSGNSKDVYMINAYTLQYFPISKLLYIADVDSEGYQTSISIEPFNDRSWFVIMGNKTYCFNDVEFHETVNDFMTEWELLQV